MHSLSGIVFAQTFGSYEMSFSSLGLIMPGSVDAWGVCMQVAHLRGKWSHGKRAHAPRTHLAWAARF